MTQPPVLSVEALAAPGLVLEELSVEPGEALALVGPGADALLQAVAGHQPTLAGRFLLDGQPAAGMPAARRPCSLVFRGLALFPHLTVGENIGFALRLRGASATAETAEVAEMMRAVGLAPDWTDRGVDALGAADRLRVALGRALMSRPRLLLLEDPLAGLAPAEAALMLVEIDRLRREAGIALMIATPDLAAAMQVADRIAVLRDGAMVQIGAPQELYFRPADAGVARLAGPTNLFEVSVSGADPSGLRLSAPDLGAGVLPLNQSSIHVRPGPALLLVRPERVQLVEEGVPARVDAVAARGGTVVMRGRLGSGAPILAEWPALEVPPVRPGEVVALAWEATDAYLLPPGPA